MADEAPSPFTPREEQEVREQMLTGRAVCPRCQLPMRERAIGGGSFGLGYARRRTWLLCPGCRTSVIFDRSRGTRT